MLVLIGGPASTSLASYNLEYQRLMFKTLRDINSTKNERMEDAISVLTHLAYVRAEPLIPVLVRLVSVPFTTLLTLQWSLILFLAYWFCLFCLLNRVSETNARSSLDGLPLKW